MSIGILDCLKRKRDICVKAIITSQNWAFMLTPALSYMDIIIIDNSLGPRKTRLDLNLYLFCNTDTQLWCPYAKTLTCTYNNLLILIGPMRTLKAETTVTNTSFCSVSFEVCWHNSVRCCGGFKPDKNNTRENRPADKRR